ncbi:hypothetical protein SALBM135S_02392 [Streptomyces alboniger]
MRPPTTQDLPYRQSQTGESPAGRVPYGLPALRGGGRRRGRPVGVAAADAIPSRGASASAKVRSGLVR